MFDVFGRCIDRPAMEDAFKSRARASKAMWAAIEKLNAKAITLAAIAREDRQHREEMVQARKIVRALP